jgi:hypothetical protein
MNTIKKTGIGLLVVQCSFNLTTIALFVFAPLILRPNNGPFSITARILVWGGGLLSIPAVGIFGYAAQKEQTYEEASKNAPEGGKIAQRDLTFAIVGFISELITLYWIL